MKKYKNFFKDKRRWLFIGLGIIVMTATAASIVRKKHRSFLKWMPKEEVKAYFETNVLPVLTEYRANLENELSATEKEEIAIIREELKSLRESKRDLRKSLREKRQKGEDLTSEEHTVMREAMREMRKLTQKAWDISDAHSEFFDSMFEETAAQRKEWRTDIFELVKKHREDLKESDEKESLKGRRHHRKHHFGEANRMFHDMSHEIPNKGFMGRSGPMGAPMQLIGSHSEVLFLLWNSENPFLHRDKKVELNENAIVYPNPAFNGSNLAYKVGKTGKVNIVLVDDKGETVATLLDEEKSSGEYTLTYDISNLREGIYFYKITTSTGSATQRFIKK